MKSTDGTVPSNGTDELIVNIFLFYLGLSKVEWLNCTSNIYTFSMHVCSCVGYVSFLDVPAVSLPRTN